MPKKKILIIGNTIKSLLNFRGKLIESLIQNNYKVVVASGGYDLQLINKLNDMNIEYRNFSLKRHSLFLFSEFITLYHLFKLFFIVKPDIVLSYSIKPNIYTGLIKYFFKKIIFFSTITGLGYSFQRTNFKRKVLEIFVRLLYSISFKHCSLVFFQNHENQKYFIENKIIELNKAQIINGSGVDIKYFSEQELQKPPLIFLMMARLLKEKGIYEYINAANIIKKKYNHVIFKLLYVIDKESKDKIDLNDLNRIDTNQNVELIKEVEDVRPIIKSSHIFVLPSYHEGSPKAVIESMSCGRAIITSNNSGCKETVINKYNGYLINHQSKFSLCKAMLKFIKFPENISKMGKNSRKLAIKKFDSNIINKIIISKIESSLKN